MTTNTHNEQRTLEDLITFEDAAEMLGVHVNTVRNWVKKGLLPVRRFGPRRLRLLPEDVHKVIEEVLS